MNVIGKLFLLRGRESTSSSGLSGTVVLCAFVATCIMFFCLNMLLSLRISRVVRDARIEYVARAGSAQECLGRAIELTDAAVEVAEYEFVKNAFVPGKTCAEQLSSLVLGLTGSTDAANATSYTKMNLGGNVHGWPMFWKSANVVSGKQFLTGIALDDPTWEAKVNAAQGENADIAKHFVAKYFDLSVEQTRPATRSLVRFNGPIQWLICFVGFTTAVLCLRRFVLLCHLLHDGFFGNAATITASFLPAAWWNFVAKMEYEAERIRDGYLTAKEFKEPETSIQRTVYSQLGHLVGILPSLGFIGTVLGMSEALLQANSLFDSADKNGAIANITSQLGYAFDTTLIGLLAVIVVGTLVLCTRLFEFKLWRMSRTNV